MGEVMVDPAAEFWPRVQAAIYAAGVSRAAVEFDWPECHKHKCQGRHGSPDDAFATMKHAIADEVEREMRWRRTTEPNLGEDNA